MYKHDFKMPSARGPSTKKQIRTQEAAYTHKRARIPEELGALPRFWNPDRTTARILINGKTGSGKSTLALTMVSNGIEGIPIPYSTCIYVTDKDHTDPLIQRVANDVKRDGRDLLVAHSDMLTLDYLRKIRPETPDQLPCHTVIILDDPQDPNNREFKKSLNWLVTQGRASGISTIYCTQGIRGVANEIDLNLKNNFEIFFFTSSQGRKLSDLATHLSTCTSRDKAENAASIIEKLGDFECVAYGSRNAWAEPLDHFLLVENY